MGSSPIGISNPKTKLVLLEKGLNCQRNLSFGRLNKKRQNNRKKTLTRSVLHKFFFFFFSKFMFIKSYFELFELLYNVFVFQETPWIVNLVPETTWAMSIEVSSMSGLLDVIGGVWVTHPIIHGLSKQRYPLEDSRVLNRKKCALTSLGRDSSIANYLLLIMQKNV